MRGEAFARDCKLLVNLEEVIAHRVFGDVQFLGSLPVAEAFDNEFCDIFLSLFVNLYHSGATYFDIGRHRTPE